jgi:hypothetical protein
MTSIQKFLSYFCLIFIVVCGAFTLSADAAGARSSFAGYNLCDGNSVQRPFAADAPCPSSSCNLWHERAETPAVNDDIARIRRSTHYQHPKSQPAILFYTKKAWQQLFPHPKAEEPPLQEYNPYYSRAHSDYYSFLFRLTPF